MWFLTEVFPGLALFLAFIFVLRQNVALRRKLQDNQLKLDIELPADVIAQMAMKINAAVKRAKEVE
ncbi:MAG: hypothetical protein V3T23_13790 [Nitrososphaerales archaeon]